MLTYRFEAEKDDNETVLLTVPTFPEVTTFAETVEEAARRVGDAIEEALSARMATGQDVPVSDADKTRGDNSWVSMSSLVTIKALLYQYMKRHNISRAELQRRLGWHREQVDRLFRLDHASRMDQLETAAAALGLKIEVNVDLAA